jgi:hypothetical protein
MPNFQLIFCQYNLVLNNMHFTDVITFTQRVIHGGFINSEQQSCEEKQACFWSVFPFHSVNRSENYKKSSVGLQLRNVLATLPELER